MAYKFKGKDGQDVTLDIEDNLGSAISQIVEGAVAPVVATIGESIRSALTEAIKPLEQKFEAMEQGDGESGKADANGVPKAKAKAAQDEPPAWAKGLIETVASISTERQADKQRSTSEQLVEAYIAKNHPNLDAGRRAFMRDEALAAAPKDEAAVRLAAQKSIARMTALGVDVLKSFGASPAAEGAKNDTGNADAEKAARIKRIREATPDVVIKS